MNIAHKERGLRCYDHEVRAIQDTRQTQIRRVVRYAKDRNRSGCDLAPCEIAGDVNAGDYSLCPYGKPGDRLWVRESFRIYDSSSECGCSDHCECHGYHGKPIYRADAADVEAKWKPSIHMPRCASRITLEITNVRVERLQDISEADAKAEGVIGEKEAADAGLGWYDKPRRAFRFLWQSINGADSWEANPWVWVVEFRRVEA